MPPIFASEDIPSLLAAFPPPLPTTNSPSLVRSYSGNHYRSSVVVLSHFRTLLESEKRIRRSDLPERLGVQSADWMFECYDDVVHWSRDGGCIVPEGEVRGLKAQLVELAGKQFVALDDFLKRVDLGSQSVDRLCEGLFRSVCGKAVYVASGTLVGQTKDDIRKVVEDSPHDKVDLMDQLPGTPRDVVFELASSCVADVPGTIDGANGQVVFIPSAYEAVQREREAGDREARALELLQTLKTKGFVEVLKGTNAEVEETRRRYESQLGDGNDDRLEMLPSEDSLVLIVPAILEAALVEMRGNIVDYLELNPYPRGETIDGALHNALITQSTNPELAKLILLTSRKSEIASMLVELLRDHTRRAFDNMIQRHLLSPLKLYMTGLEAIGDHTLQQRLDAYILDYFKTEALPHFDKSIREQDLLSADKTRSKELEKCTQLAKSAANLTDFEAVISKFAKKSKIPHASAEELASTKHAILNQKVKGMKGMSRASDVLQNVTWILLAEKCDGLFMSPGKDTSRMIKQYLRLGNNEHAAQLEKWRDTIKKNEQSNSDVKDMIELAASRVPSIVDNTTNAG